MRLLSFQHVRELRDVGHDPAGLRLALRQDLRRRLAARRQRRLRARGAPGRVPLLTVLLWLLPLAFAVLTRTRVYNGWRHFYFLYGPMLALAVLGARELWTYMRGARRRVFAALLGLFAMAFAFRRKIK